MDVQEMKDFLEEDSKRQKKKDEVIEAYEKIYRNFLQEFEAVEKINQIRATILIAHLYADFYVTELIKASLFFYDFMGGLSKNDEDYDFLDKKRLGFRHKIYFLNMYMLENQDKKLIKDLKELDTNRNRIAHVFEIKKLKLDDKKVDINADNIVKINLKLKETIKSLHNFIIAI